MTSPLVFAIPIIVVVVVGIALRYIRAAVINKRRNQTQNLIPLSTADDLSYDWRVAFPATAHTRSHHHHHHHRNAAMMGGAGMGMMGAGIGAGIGAGMGMGTGPTCGGGGNGAAACGGGGGGAACGGGGGGGGGGA